MSNIVNWITATPLESGPISQDNYTYNITGLCENTIYQYRAYVVISGSPYYGEIKTITTCSGLQIPAMVSTGNAYDVTDTTMRMCDNVVTVQGSTPVSEYGILYTQNPSYSTQGTLIYNTSETPTVCMISTCATIPTGQTYYLASNGEICNLAANTLTYYRAFAINSAGIGYGEIKCQLTDITTYPTKTVDLVRTQNPSIDCSIGLICMSPDLAGNETVSVIVDIEQLNALGSEGQTVAEITCTYSGSESAPISIFCCSSVTGVISNNNLIIPMVAGDIIAWSQSVGGDSGSYSTIRLDSVNSATCVNAVLSSTNNCNTSYSSELGDSN